MLFSSITFLYYFLPAVLLLYTIVPARLRNGVLLAASLFFYAWGEPKYVLLMLAEILVGYLSGLFLAQPTGRQKAGLAVSVLIPLGLLGYFKYADFFLENVNAVTGLALPLPKIGLPIGISFFTFQIISYQVDVYRGTVKAQRDPVALAAYVAMFPQLIAGPIVRYEDIEGQLQHRTLDVSAVAYGIRRFLLGLGKKVLLANRLGELCTLYRSAAEPSILFAWMYAIAFMLQIYFDFSGYSDMAIGLGRILGFRFPENFRYPYMADSITEFWRRWHMTLGSWFRDYVYIPLGGNRVSKAAHLRNILVVWLLTGIWHGAAWNYVVWGLFFAVLLMLEKQWLPHVGDRGRWFRHVCVLFLVMISFVIFNAADLKGAGEDILSLFGAGGLPLWSAETVYDLKSYGITLAAAAVGATSLPVGLMTQIKNTQLGGKILSVLEPIALLGLLVLVTAWLVDGSYNPFLYFRF